MTQPHVFQVAVQPAPEFSWIYGYADTYTIKNLGPFTVYIKSSPFNNAYAEDDGNGEVYPLAQGDMVDAFLVPFGEQAGYSMLMAYRTPASSSSYVSTLALIRKTGSL